ncbi:hypothetical protein LEN26_000603 [Aphanomyces euteiches]|nr:hypothetical protein AeMF1_019122 [Aphanomyces euteiches]KAH9163190.1 hypothetical protein LEN26_000603 [Aphanomyces euteiches]KAH9195924.1 hypothetical protein AeNC1_002113 [Aphanomyces euteiches]
MEKTQPNDARKQANTVNPYGTFNDNSNDVCASPGHETSSCTKWTMVSILSLLSCLNQAICYTYAPVSHMAEANWNNQIRCTTLITIYFIAYIPFAFVGSWIMDKKGLRFGVLLGAALQALGASLRYVAEIEPSAKLLWLVGGQTLSAIAMPFMVNSPPMLSALWFPPHQRAMATSIAVNCNQLGIALVYIICPLFVSTQTDVVDWTAFIAVFSVAAFALAWCFFKASSKFIKDEASYDWNQWLSAFHHDGFALTVFVFAVAETVTNVLSSLLNHLLNGDVFTKAQKGLIGAAFIISALVGGQIVSAYIDGTRLHKQSLIACLFVTGLSLLAFQVAASSAFNGQIIVTMGCLMLAGLFLGPLQPISLELGVECAHPTTEATVAALQQLCGNLLSALLVPALGAIQHTAEEFPAAETSWLGYLITPPSVLSMFAFVAALLFCTFRGQFKRSAQEQANAAEV